MSKILGADGTSKQPSVMVALPSHDRVHAAFAYDLANLMTVLGGLVGQGKLSNVGIFNQRGTYIHSARQTLAVAAVKQYADYILWLDADMRIPRDAFIRLYHHHVPIVGINYSKRGIPPTFVAVKDMDNNVQCRTDEDSTGLEEVEAIGFGCVLMRTDILADLHDPYGEKGPWFNHEWDAENRRMWGEDTLFCRYLREAGHRIFVDHDLSKDCAHLGEFTFRCEHAAGNFTDETED